MLARTIAAIPASAISSIFDQATALREGGRDLVDFSIGEPDFDTPAHICEAGAQAIADGITRYTSTDGTAALKDAIARKFLRDNGLKFSRTEIVVGAGAKPLLATAVQAVINPGEEAILTSPAWASHLGMLQLAGARPVLLETNLEGKFKLTASALEAAITPATRLLILCSPSNPTGAVYSAEQLQALAEVLRRHPQVLVISDDLYEHIVFDGHEFATLVAVAPDLSERVLTVNGVSKAYAMTGWRIGFGGGPKWWTDGIRLIFSQNNGGPCSISQIAAAAALDGPREFLAEWRDIYRRRRDLAVAGINSIDGLQARAPEGAFYIMPDCGGLIGKCRPDGQIIESSTDLAAWFLDAGVVVVPGAGFSCDPYFRLSIALSEAEIKRGLQRMAAACDILK